MSTAATVPPAAAEPGEFRKSNHARKRQRIMDAAASVFAEAGYSGASTAAIAARLGMTQSNLYYYFRSKDEALEKICLVALEGYIRGAKANLASKAPFRRRLLEAVASHLTILTERPDHFVTFLTCRHELPAAGRHRVGRITRAYEELIERLIAEGRASGAVGQDVDPAFMKSVEQGFLEYGKRLTTTARESGAAKAHRASIEDCLVNAFGLEESGLSKETAGDHWKT